MGTLVLCLIEEESELIYVLMLLYDSRSVQSMPGNDTEFVLC